MRRIAADKAPEANDGIVFPGFGEHAGGGWNFKRSGYADQRDVFLLSTRAEQSVVGALKEPFRDEGVEARNNNSKPLSGTTKSAFDRWNFWLGWAFDFYFLFRFSLRNSASRR
jgi:hypothetical protein